MSERKDDQRLAELMRQQYEKASQPLCPLGWAERNAKI